MDKPRDIEALAAEAFTALAAQEPPHPLLPLPTPEELAGILALPDGQDRLDGVLRLRRQMVTDADQYTGDPLAYEPEPFYWRDADRLLATPLTWLILLGGNRSAKSWYCAKRSMQSMVRYPGSLLLCLAEDETTSRQTQQVVIWHYLPREWKALRDRKDKSGIYKINYTEAGGFTERLCVLPNRSKIFFKTYNQNPAECEGWEFGARSDLSIGVWPDENLRLNWQQMFERRIKFRPAQVVWSYTPVSGMTPTIRQAVGEAQTLESKPASLLPPERVHVKGVPPGHMPYVQKPRLANARVIYFHSEMSPFGPGPNGSGRRYFEGVKELCEGKPSEYTMKVAYGYTSDVSGRAFPKFSGANVVREEHLPAEGTLYHFTDPAGNRNWAQIWVLVAPGNPARLYIVRDWPDEARYGEWAVPSTRAVDSDSRAGWDGDPGPAQRTLGYGIARYKRLMLEEETLGLAVRRGGWAEKDPRRRALLDAAMAEAGVVQGPQGWTEEDLVAFRKAHPEPVRELVRERYVDPRAVTNPQHSAEQGGVTIVDLFAREQKQGDEVIGPRMTVFPAYSGKGIDDGLNQVNDLLDYNEAEPLVPLLNEPRLYVSERCRQVRWMFENYTGLSGEKGAAKDFADLVRYACLTELRHVTPEMMKAVEGGSY